MLEHVITDTPFLGSLIRERRRALGLRQNDLAMMANVGIRFIVDIENGKETCQVGRVIKLMAALDIRLAATMPDVLSTEPHIATDESDELDLWSLTPP